MAFLREWAWLGFPYRNGREHFRRIAGPGDQAEHQHGHDHEDNGFRQGGW
jgi:hypothetical protein